MKKMLGFMLLIMSVVALVGCGGVETGEFPEVRERNLVEMSGEDMAVLLNDAETIDLNQDAMRMSLDLEGYFIEETMKTWDTSYESMTEIDLSSTIHVLMSEDISEVRLHAENQIDMHQEPVVSGDVEAETTDVAGRANVYFYNQFLYTDMELTDDAEAPVEGIENGQYKYNLGITQSMWDELYANLSLDALEGMFDLPDAGMPDESWTDGETFQVLMDQYPGIRVYESGGDYTVIVDVTKTLLSEHATDVVTALAEQQGQPMSTEDIEAFESDLETELAAYDTIDAQIALVIEDDRMIQYAFDVNVELTDSEEFIDMTLIVDVGVAMPEFPDDLEDYELKEFSFDPFLGGNVPTF